MIFAEQEERASDTNDSGFDTEKEDDNTPRGNKQDIYIPTQSEESLEVEEDLFTSPLRKIIKGSARTQTQVDSVEDKKERGKKRETSDERPCANHAYTTRPSMAYIFY